MHDTYNSTRWQKKRATILRRDGYRCRECSRYGRIREGTTVHHIFPVEFYPQEIYNDHNLITLCRDCHNKMHDRDTHALTEAGKKLQVRAKRRFGEALPPLSPEKSPKK